MKKNKKKGFLLGTVSVKLLIAVVCILLLAIAAVKIFGIFGKENDFKKAEEELGKLKERINIYLEQDTDEPMIVMFFAPKGGEEGWYFVSFLEGYFPERQCVGRYESCLCLCEKVKCEGLKACKGFERDIIIGESEYKINMPLVVQFPSLILPSLIWDAGLIGTYYNGALQFDSVPQDIAVLKHGESIVIVKVENEKQES